MLIKVLGSKVNANGAGNASTVGNATTVLGIYYPTFLSIAAT